MSSSNAHSTTQRTPHGQIGYVQLPAVDVAKVAEFYRTVFGWSVELEYSSFEAPGMIGQFTTDRLPGPENGPLLWIAVDNLSRALQQAVEAGGSVRAAPQLDNAERWLAELDDPAGNRIGIVAAARTAQPQTLLAVQDVEASSRWYSELLGLVGDHGGPEYERLLSDGTLVLQLHHQDVEHHHGPIGDRDQPVGNGVLVWFGEVTDFDGVVARAAQRKASIVRAPHRNPPDGEGNGPAHRELWLRDPDGYTVVVASPDGEAYELG